MSRPRVARGTSGRNGGTLLLVSHDRDFSTTCEPVPGFEGEGRVAEYVGGYSDWLRKRGRARSKTTGGGGAKPVATASVTTAAAVQPIRRKLGFKEQRELDLLPARIESLEAQIAALGVAMQAADFYQRDGVTIASTLNEVSVLQAELDAAYARWTQLEPG